MPELTVAVRRHCPEHEVEWNGLPGCWVRPCDLPGFIGGAMHWGTWANCEIVYAAEYAKPLDLGGSLDA